MSSEKIYKLLFMTENIKNRINKETNRINSNWYVENLNELEIKCVLFLYCLKINIVPVKKMDSLKNFSNATKKNLSFLQIKQVFYFSITAFKRKRKEKK